MNARIVGTISAALLCSAAGVASAQVLYDNGPVVTHPAQGAGGADVSMCSLNPNSAGSNMRQQADVVTFRAADDWEVPAGQTWKVRALRLSGYATNAAPGVPGWTGYSLKIWQDMLPNDGAGNFHNTTAAPAIAWSGVYRVFNGGGNLLSTARALNDLTFSFSPELSLPGGTYWFDLQVIGAATGWYNYVMDINPANPLDPITRVGNALQRTAAGWIGAVAGSPTVQVAYPFQVIGVVNPTCPGTGPGACSRADWNEDGVIDFNDLLGFLNDFNAQDDCADLNGDGVVDFNDFLEFLNIYNNGC